MLIFHSDQLIK